MISGNVIAAGPPGAKIPVAALTGTTSTTVYQEAPVTGSSPKPASRSSSPLPKSTSFTHTTSSESPAASTTPANQGQSAGSTGGDTGGSDSSGSGSSGPQGDTGSSGSSAASGSSGDVGNTGDTGNTGASGNSGSDTGTGGNDGETGSTLSGNDQQGGGESGDNTGPTYTTASSVNVGSSVATGSSNSGQSGASGSNGDSGSLSGGEHSISDNGSGSQDGGGQGNTGSSGSSNSVSGGESPVTNDLPSIAPFVVTAGGHTISGIVQGSTAAVVAGNTIIAGSSPSSAGGALVSIHPGASSIYVNGESHPLPTAQASHLSAIPIATIGSHILSASPGVTAVYYADKTLTQNGAHVTIDNTDVYVGSSGLVVGGSSTIDIPRLSPTSITASSLQVTELQTFTLGGQILSADSTAVYAGKSTLAVGGPAVTISGTPISLGSSDIVVASKTYTIPSGALPSGTLPGATQTSDGLGAIILGAFGSHTSTALPSGSSIASSNTSGALAFQGAAAKPDQCDSMAILGALLVGGFFLFVNGL